MLRATLKNLFARKLRLLLSAMSIVLGVSFVSGAFVLTDSLGKVFDDLFSTVNQNIAVDVRGAKITEGGQGESAARALVPASVVDTVAAVDGVAEAQPNVVGVAQLVDAKGKVVGSNTAPAFGFNWYDSAKLMPGRITEGRAPASDSEIVINRGLAETAKYKVGDRAPVLTDAPAKTYTIVGIMEYTGGKASLAGETSIFFDTATAQKVLNTPNAYSDILVAAEEGVSQDELATRVDAALPPQIETITGDKLADEQASEVKQGLGFFNTFLLTFAAIALFVGSFIIFNTFSMLVAQRTRELALMRALGASRAQVTRSVLLEAVIIGVISSVIGLLLGIGVAIGLKALFGAFGAELPDGPTIVAPRTIVAAFAVGILVTALAALMPARRASKVPPIAALRDAATPDRSLRRQTVIGAVILLLGAAAMTSGLQGGGLRILGLGTLLAFVGVAMLSPLVSKPVAGAVGRLFTRKLPGRLGRENSLRNPRRTASTAAALMIGLALISAVSVLGSSLKATVEKVTADAVGAEFLLTVSGQGLGFPDSVVTQVGQEPGVASAAGLKFDAVQVGADQEFATAVPAAAIGTALKLTKVAGETTLQPGRVLLSEDEAKRRNLKPGDTLEIAFPRSGPQKLTVGGTYEANELVGDFLLDESQAKGFTNTTNVVALVKVAPAADLVALRSALEKDVAAYPNVSVQDQSEFVAQAAGQVNQVVTIINILLGLSVLIALLGVINTLALSVIERTRELGLLRAVGMARKQVKRMIRVESVVICTFGGLLGLAVGSVFGVALQRGLKDDGVTELAFPVGTLLLFLLGAALAGVIAAWLPARRASRLNVLTAIATE